MIAGDALNGCATPLTSSGAKLAVRQRPSTIVVMTALPCISRVLNLVAPVTTISLTSGDGAEGPGHLCGMDTPPPTKSPHEEIANLFCIDVPASGEFRHIDVLKPEPQRLVLEEL
jgi:hypothetical protein